jgi:pyridinium-3,5-bisthiocarboxylic acid mononucleotide nickel chelatase
MTTTTSFAYFDCFAGISGDMALGALLDAGGDLDALRTGLRGLDLDPFELDVSTVERGGIGATRVEVRTGPPGAARDWGDVRSLLGAARLPEAVRARALATFERLAEAEGRVHRMAPDQVHFHEVGAVDALVDVVGTALLLHDLGVEEAWASPVATGGGRTRGAHGPLPVPAPAVLELLRGAPLHGGGVPVELTTPTGAAILAASVTSFAELPPLRVASVGYGAGARQLDELPNLLRVILGERLRDEGGAGDGGLVLEANLDDMIPELMPWVMERLFAAGAADVWLTPVQMKKGRPGITISALCPPGSDAAVRTVLWRETSTLGVRGVPVRKWMLERRTVEVGLLGGKVRVKLGLEGGRVVNVAPEFADCTRLADQSGRPLKEVMARAQAAALAELDAAPGHPGQPASTDDGVTPGPIGPPVTAEEDGAGADPPDPP